MQQKPNFVHKPKPKPKPKSTNLKNAEPNSNSMSCSVAASTSPAFSPRSSFFLSKGSIISAAPESLNLTLAHLKSSTSTNKPGLGLGSVPKDLKRKRPARLAIPVAAAMTFGAPERREIESEGDGYSVYCKRGRREAMEDRFSAVENLQGDSKQAFFGVFDGHGGSKAAEFAAKNLHKNIFNEVVRRDEDGIRDGVKSGYLKSDTEFLKEETSGGTCCVTALIRKGNLVVSNAGDCRAVMSRGGVAEALTSDHKASRKDERDRIENLGGYVYLRHGVWRVQGTLAVSRGIGDRHLKKWVVAEPDTKIIQIQPDHEFLILASDGLWDKVSNQEAVDIARASCIAVDKPEPLLACKKLTQLAVSRGSSDDISVMLIQLGHYV